MIATLKGMVQTVAKDSAILDVWGVGYELHCSQNTLDDLSSRLGKEIGLFVHTHLREDALVLFGFSTAAEKNLFLALIKVNGVGPKVACSALSGASISKIIQMIDSDDVKGLTQLPKIGRKTAEQIILSLKGKLVLEERNNERPHEKPQTRRELHSALLNLGFRGLDIDKAVGSLPEEISLEDGLRQALAALTSI